MTKKKFEAVAFAVDDEGRGMVADNGVTFFVPNLLKGEKAEIETTFSYGKPSDARVVKRLTNSPDRVTPKCKYYDKCGGCSIMHMSYESQLKYKQEKVYNLLKKLVNSVPIKSIKV